MNSVTQFKYFYFTFIIITECSHRTRDNRHQTLLHTYNTHTLRIYVYTNDHTICHNVYLRASIHKYE